MTDPYTKQDQATEVAGFSLYPDDIDVIATVAKRNGSSKSQALRFIIRSFARTSGYNDWAKKELATEPQS